MIDKEQLGRVLYDAHHVGDDTYDAFETLSQAGQDRWQRSAELLAAALASELTLNTETVRTASRLAYQGLRRDARRRRAYRCWAPEDDDESEAVSIVSSADGFAACDLVVGNYGPISVGDEYLVNVVDPKGVRSVIRVSALLKATDVTKTEVGRTLAGESSLPEKR